MKPKIIKGIKPTQSEVQDLWDSPLNTKSRRALKKMSDKAKDKKPTLKQLELM